MSWLQGPTNAITYDGNGKPSVSAFSIQLDQARAELRRRHPLGIGSGHSKTHSLA
jgi:hypothetical protein